MNQILRAAISLIVFMVALLLVYVIHIKYFRVNVVFYSAIADAFIAAGLTCLVIWKLKFFSQFSNFERSLIIGIWVLVGYALSISVPTVIDRSLSLYILEKVQQRGGGIRQDAFEDVFTKEYIREHRLVDVRLTEQIESGTIEIQNGCVKLTAKGERIAQFSRYFRQNWLPNQRLLMGSYSDDLTDPFRNSIDDPGYKCK